MARPEVATESSGKAKYTPVFRVSVDSDYGIGPSNASYAKEEAKRIAAELSAIDKLLAMDDATLAKYARAQLEAQKELCAARQKLNKAEGMKLEDVFSDMKDGDESDTAEVEAEEPAQEEKSEKEEE